MVRKLFVIKIENAKYLMLQIYNDYFITKIFTFMDQNTIMEYYIVNEQCYYGYIMGFCLIFALNFSFI